MNKKGELLSFGFDPSRVDKRKEEFFFLWLVFVKGGKVGMPRNFFTLFVYPSFCSFNAVH